MSNPHHRSTHDLTLGFLTLGVQPAPLDVLAAASYAGFGAAGLRVSGRHPGDAWPHATGSEALAAIADRAASHGVRISSISGYYMSQHASPEHLLANVDAAKRLATPMISQACFDPDLDRAAALLHDYARAAADAGIRIALEFMPMSTVRSLADAQQLIARSGASNVGLLIDALHLARSGAGPVEVCALDAGSIYLTQLCDAPRERSPDVSLFEEAMSGRMHPGDGGLDLRGLVQALPPGAEIELETPVASEADRPSDERARRAAQKAEAFFAVFR
jgi:sugar phosphate isomerase/epimerase